MSKKANLIIIFVALFLLVARPVIATTGGDIGNDRGDNDRCGNDHCQDVCWTSYPPNMPTYTSNIQPLPACQQGNYLGEACGRICEDGCISWTENVVPRCSTPTPPPTTPPPSNPPYSAPTPTPASFQQPQSSDCVEDTTQGGEPGKQIQLRQLRCRPSPQALGVSAQSQTSLIEDFIELLKNLFPH